MNMTRILVTGAAGFLGFHLARALAKREGYTVICVDNMSRGDPDDAYIELCALPNVTRLDLDLSIEAEVAKLPLDVAYVYHLAALNGTQNFYERPMDVIRSCTLPTIHLCQHYGANGKGLKRFVYAGTSESYASTVSLFNWPVPTSEEVPLSIDDPANPRWSYAASKMHGEVVVNQAARSFGFPMTTIRYHNAYGPRMGDKHVIPDFLERVKENRYELFGHADTRSFIYADDAVRATLIVGESEACANQTINIGGNSEMTMLELAKHMMRICAREGEILLHPSPKGSVKRRAPDLSKLKRLTGFEEQIDLDSGLQACADFYLDGVLHGPLNPPEGSTV
jgi:UDP-glucose 4-epimerase